MRSSRSRSTWEDPIVLRFLGIAFLVAILCAVWLTWAFYTKAFTEYDEVTLTAAKSGLALPERADVKLRGMTVGVVRETKVDDGTVEMTLGMDPQLIDRVPRNVRAEIVPKTLFGEKYVSLIPRGGTGEHLRAGDTITDAVVPVEFEEFFNDVDPLLSAVPPEQVASTLTALANSLEGRGDALGQTLEDSNAYLARYNPENKQAIADIVALGEVSNTYARRMDNLGELLENSAELSETVVDKESELAETLGEGARLADVLHDFLDAAGDDVIVTADNSVQPLQVLDEYASLIPCFFKGTNALAEKTDSIMMNNTIHGVMVIENPQPTRYGLPSDPEPEHPTLPSPSELEAWDFHQPEVRGYLPNPAEPNNPFPAGMGTICDELYAAAAGDPRSPDELLRWPRGYWKMFGIKNSHNGRFGDEADFDRARLAGPTLPNASRADASSWGPALLGPVLR